MDANVWIFVGIVGTAYGMYLIVRTVLRDRSVRREQFAATKFFGPNTPLYLLLASAALAFIRYYPVLTTHRPGDFLNVLSTLSYAISYYFLAGLISVIMPASRSDGAIRNKSWAIALAMLWLLAFFANPRVAN